MKKEKSDEIIGREVRIKSCEAAEHGDNSGCVCDLIGAIVTIEKRYKTPYVGTASYHIKGMDKRVRRREVVLLRQAGRRVTTKQLVNNPAFAERNEAMRIARGL